MKKFLILPVVLLILLILGIVGVLGFRYIVSAPSQDTTPVSFTIAKGEPVAQIADELASAHLVRSSFVYRLFVRFSGFDGKIQAGIFKLSPSLSMKDLTYELARGTTDQTITILEGWRIEEMAEYLEKKQVVSREEFLEAAGSNQFSYDFLPSYKDSDLDKPYRRLEGYLFPDTYQISAQSSAKTIIDKMLQNFNTRVTAQMKTDLAANKLSLADTITLASIVEREARSDINRAIVAGILIKRVQTPGHRIESDVTEQFILGKSGQWWSDLPDAAKNISPDNAYNSFTHDGLPPTPVDNPGLSSIKATVYPQASDYWFYLTGKDGVMHFAKTLDEHQANIQKYL